MPPKRAATAANGTTYDLTQANLNIIRAALCCVEEFKPNWGKVFSEFGLSKGHGLRDFRTAIKGLGLDIKDNKVFVGFIGTNHNVTQANLSMIRAALCCVEQFKPNWGKVFSDFGLSKGHGLRDFRAGIKGLGLDIKDGKVFVANNNGNGAPAPAAAAAAAPAPANNTVATAAATNTTTNGRRKRKSPSEDTDQVEEDSEEEEAPAKKKKKTAKVATKNAVVKKEPKTEADEADA